MSLVTVSPSASANPNESSSPSTEEIDPYEGIDLRDVAARLCRGLAPTLGLAALGLAVASLIYLLVSPVTTATTSMRVMFSFSGYAKGEYPDNSTFQPDDLRAPDIITEALKRLGLDVNEDLQTRVRAALSVEGIIPASVTKEQDRIRAAGRTPTPYIPDEYLVTLTLPRKIPVSDRQRERLLTAIVNAYQEKFQRTYSSIPTGIGNAFESLRGADYYQYEIILDAEIQSITAYLNRELEQAKTFRSQTTNLTFSDLLSQTKLFSQARVDETLGLIQQNGLSRNRANALVEIDYSLRTLEDREQKAIEDEKVIDDLLNKSQARAQDYVLGNKSAANQQRSDAPVIDQGLIDSLLKNDSTNFLIRQALDTGLKVKSIQAEKAQLQERRKDIEDYMNRKGEDQSALIGQVQRSLGNLEVAYNRLIKNIRATQADFAKQQYADAIQISMEPVTGSLFKPLAVSAAVGAIVGLALGMGLSLLGVYIGEKYE